MTSLRTNYYGEIDIIFWIGFTELIVLRNGMFFCWIYLRKLGVLIDWSLIQIHVVWEWLSNRQDDIQLIN